MSGVMLKSVSSPMSSSIRDDDDDSDDGGIQLHGQLKLKNVLYYKDHHKRALPKAKGTLILGPQTISFQSKGLDYSWNLNVISVERFKGRVKGGIKILGQRQTRNEDVSSSVGEEEDEFVFTNVKQRSYDIICEGIDEVKFDSEMKRTRRDSMVAISNSAGELSKTLSIIEKPKPSSIMKPFRIIFMVIYKIISFIYKLFTGRRLFGPKNLPQALHGVLVKINPIVKVARMTLSQRKVLAIEKDVKCISDSMLKMQRTVRRQQSEFRSSGLVVEGAEGSLVKQKTLSYHQMRSRLSYLWFTIRQTLNIPRFIRPDIIQPYQYPSTVGQAVQNANDRILALVELADNQEYNSPGDIVANEVLGEAKHMQMLLYNIKQHAAGRDSRLSSSMRQKEE